MPSLRTLGSIAMLGGLAYTIAGLRMLLLGAPEDRLTDVLGVLWAACWVAGGWALLRLGVTGTGLPARAASAVLLLGFCMAVLWGIYRLIDPVAADRSVIALAPMVVILGMLATGILVLQAGVWTDLRRFVPLLIATIYVCTVVISVRTGESTLGYAFSLAGPCYTLLGAFIRAAGAPLVSTLTATSASSG